MDDFQTITELTANDPTDVTLKIYGALTMINVAKLQTELIGVLDYAKTIKLDISGIKELDAAGMQLLCSAHISSIDINTEFNLIGDNDQFWKMATASGHTRKSGCTHNSHNSCIWHKENP